MLIFEILQVIGEELGKSVVHKNFQYDKGYYMGLDTTKPALGVSDKVSFKLVSSATETS